MGGKGVSIVPVLVTVCLLYTELSIQMYSLFQVRYDGYPRAGYSVGYCTRAGKCVATPRECTECNQYCKKYHK